MSNHTTSYALHSAPEQPWLRRFSKLVCLATLLLIFFGGQVKSHEAGLAVPDWPLTYGQNPITYPISDWTGGIFHEHFHRLFAGVVASMTVLLAIWLQVREPRRWVRILGWLAVGAVLFQALLGGLTVIFHLPTAVSSSHAILAQTFFVITCILAYALSREAGQTAAAVSPRQRVGALPVFRATVVLIGLIYVQLFLGALMRHTNAGLAIPDFPTTAGRIVPAFNDETLAWVNDWRFDHAYYRGVDLPPVTLGQMVIHFSHRLGAIAVTAGMLIVLVRAWRRRAEDARVARTALVLCGIVLVQFTLGMFTVWTVKLPLLTSIHVMTGAALLGVAVLLAMRVCPWGAAEAAAASAGEPAGLRAAVT